MGALEGKGALVTGGRLEDLRRLSAQVADTLEGLDIVVINAAGGTGTAIDAVTEDDYDQFMAVHAKGPFFLIQYAGRALRDGGRIISISTLNTELLRSANPGETFEGEVASTALKRLGQPEDIASVVAFLAGPDGGWISGQNLVATGGFMP